MVRYSILLSGLIFSLGAGQAVVGAQAMYPCPCPCPGQTMCTPNVAGFGYYPTVWRQWPGEKRLEVKNPRAVGLPVLPTPEGQEHIEAPTMGPTQGPMQGMPGGELLPPSGAILPPQEPTQPTTPPEEGLPGLPVEPEPEVLPGLPEETTPTGQPSAPSSDKPGEGARRQRYLRSTAAVPFETRKSEPKSTVVFLVDGKPADGNQVEQTSYQTETAASLGSDPASAQGGENAAYAIVESAGANEAFSDAKVSAPPVALGGYCPVDLILNGRWTAGDLRYTVVHDGAIFRLSGEAQWRQFQEKPEDFLPAYSGNDPVKMIDEQSTVPGQVTYCALYNGRLYMFSNTATQARFNKNPQRYVLQK